MACVKRQRREMFLIVAACAWNVITVIYSELLVKVALESPSLNITSCCLNSPGMYSCLLIHRLYIAYMHINDRAWPVVVVHVLAYECVRLHRAVRIHLGHIHVVYKVDESSAAWRSIVAACFLLKGLFQHRCAGEEWTSRERKCGNKSTNTEKGVMG